MPSPVFPVGVVMALGARFLLAWPTVNPEGCCGDSRGSTGTLECDKRTPTRFFPEVVSQLSREANNSKLRVRYSSQFSLNAGRGNHLKQ
jgi:hypothetical protein